MGNTWYGQRAEECPVSQTSDISVALFSAKLRPGSEQEFARWEQGVEEMEE